MIKGITVKIIPFKESGTDDFGAPVMEESDPISVDNVLVAPVSSSELLDISNLYGKKAVYQLGIPKDDTNTWENQIVEFFGQRWHVFSVSQKGIDANIPLTWNDKYMVERYE